MTQYRKKAISADRLNRLEAIFQETLDKWGGQLVEFNGEAAHVAQFTCWSKFGIAESSYEYQFCIYPKVSLSLGFKNCRENNSYPKSATPKIHLTVKPIDSKLVS